VHVEKGGESGVRTNRDAQKKVRKRKEGGHAGEDALPVPKPKKEKRKGRELHFPAIKKRGGEGTWASFHDLSLLVPKSKEKRSPCVDQQGKKGRGRGTASNDFLPARMEKKRVKKKKKI